MLRTGTGFDSHRFEGAGKLVLGGVTIEGSTGLKGHSDADVLSHAVIDALMGAAAQGDIGGRFPDSGDKWKGVSSIEMLKITVDEMAGKGFQVVNVDTTVIAERPKLTPWIDKIRKSLGETLSVDVSRISVKAKTAESMGALGRGEGMAAMAAVLVEETEK
ncbi:MAG: 2-C-methyl-D-erythritol 2,4-cyclodiphosphate synthase [Kiritimatiellia bacterium]